MPSTGMIGKMTATKRAPVASKRKRGQLDGACACRLWRRCGNGIYGDECHVSLSRRRSGRRRRNQAVQDRTDEPCRLIRDAVLYASLTTFECVGPYTTTVVTFVDQIPGRDYLYWWVKNGQCPRQQNIPSLEFDRALQRKKCTLHAHEGTMHCMSCLYTNP